MFSKIVDFVPATLERIAVRLARIQAKPEAARELMAKYRSDAALLRRMAKDFNPERASINAALSFFGGGGHVAMEPIMVGHPDKKIVALAHAFEEMLQHPLAKRFKRGKIGLFVDHTGAFHNLGGGATVKTIYISEPAIRHLTPEELRGVVGHELGHVLNLDYHPRSIRPKTKKAIHRLENMADEIGVVLSGQPEAIKSVLDKASRQNNAVLREQNNTERKAWIDSVATRIATPEGRSRVEEELALRLETKHRKLFAHQYRRDTVNHPHTR